MVRERREGKLKRGHGEDKENREFQIALSMPWCTVVSCGDVNQNTPRNSTALQRILIRCLNSPTIDRYKMYIRRNFIFISEGPNDCCW